jgi:hypothetical protein
MAFKSHDPRHDDCIMLVMIDSTRQFGHAALTWLTTVVGVLWGATLWLWSLAFGPRKSPATVRAETKRRHKEVLRRLRGLE